MLTGTQSYASGIGVSGGATLQTDPAVITTSTLAIDSASALQAAAGDLFKLTGDFLSHSTQSATWNTAAATLQFTGGGSHTMLLTGIDLGARPAVAAHNFSWGAVVIDAGDVLSLGDGLDDPLAHVALYVGDLVGALIVGDDVTNIFGNGYDIYYDPFAAENAYLGGRTYQLADDGGWLVAVPAPAPLAVLVPGLAFLLRIKRKRLYS